MIVDDDQDTLDTLGMFFRMSEFTVSFAHSGIEAYEKINEGGKLFDSIIFDVKMPYCELPEDVITESKTLCSIEQYPYLLELYQLATEMNSSVLCYFYSGERSVVLHELVNKIGMKGFFQKLNPISDMVAKIQSDLAQRDYSIVQVNGI